MDHITHNISQIKEILINGYVSTKTSADSGYMLIDDKFDIVFANEFCSEYFDIRHHKHNISCIDLFKKINRHVVMQINHKIFDANSVLLRNDLYIEKIYNTAVQSAIAIQFIYFATYKKSLKSLLVNLVPYSDTAGTPILIQAFFSRFDFWGFNNNFNLLDAQERYKGNCLYLGNSNSLPIKLSPRHEEIVFILSQGVGLRHTAEILKISYGTLVSALKNYIYPKFAIEANDVNLLIQKATLLGYDQIIPQSLCCPDITIIDSQIREKYFSN